ncbi:MAG: hypothetical protein JWM36_4211 [Hyphomicrobiales bacterium]|nr:hypothetical protein [Hyphomicrobiales bacterium]
MNRQPAPLAAPRAARPVPAWARPCAPTQELAEAAFCAGAALASLDALVRADATHAGAWRQRLALTAAAASMSVIGRGEDEAMLRDAWCLRRPGDDPGPAGRVLGAWRRQVQRSARLDPAMVAATAVELGPLVDSEAICAAGAAVLASRQPAILAAAEMAARVVALHPRAELLALWLADQVLAARLSWPIPVPLLAGSLAHPALRAAGRRRARPGEEGWPRTVAAAYALAAARAVGLFADLERRAATLQAVTPVLRARGAAAVVAVLLEEDAMAPASAVGTMTDRGLRRLFDRLVGQGAVRELTGRTTFRLYGL